jgi:hypothetical protein
MTLHIVSYLAKKNVNTEVILIVSEAKVAWFSSQIFKLHENA